MSEEKKNGLTGEEICKIISMYGLGTKKNGSPRAIYDIVKDYTKPKKKKGKKHKKDTSVSVSSIYLSTKKGKKKKKKKDKHWHI